MNYRIEISPLPRWRDARGEGVRKKVKDSLGIALEGVRTRDVYTVSAAISADEAKKLAELLYNPVLQCWCAADGHSANYAAPKTPAFVLVVGYRPGVTDNVGRTFRAAAADILGRRLRDDEFVASSIEYLLYSPTLTRDEALTIGRKLLANELIQTVLVLDAVEAERGIPLNLPRVTGSVEVKVARRSLEVSDAELERISREGTLALSLPEMKSIQNYFRTAKGREKVGLGAEPTDVELEVLAQTWSEHCKHKIFSAKIDYTDAETGEKREIVSCYKTFIQKSTKEIASQVSASV